MVAFRLPVVPSGIGDYGDAAPTSGAFAYDTGYPDAMGDPRRFMGQSEPGGSGVSTDGLMLMAQDVMDYTPADASLAYLRGDFARVGGQTGATNRNGWSDGTRKYDRNIHHFTGRYVRFFRRALQNDRGPVGRSNYAGKLTSGVNSQYDASLPSLEEIARGFTGRQ